MGTLFFSLIIQSSIYLQIAKVKLNLFAPYCFFLFAMMPLNQFILINFNYLGTKHKLKKNMHSAIGRSFVCK